MQLNLVRGVKINKKGFHRYIGQKRWAKKSLPPLINEKREVGSTDMEKAELLSGFFALIFTGNQDSYAYHVPESLGKDWGKKIPPTIKAEQVRKCLMRLNVYKSVGPDGMHTRVRPTWLLGHSPSYLKSHCCQMKSSVSGERETSLSFIRKGERKSQGTTSL